MGIATSFVAHDTLRTCFILEGTLEELDGRCLQRGLASRRHVRLELVYVHKRESAAGLIPLALVQLGQIAQTEEPKARIGHALFDTFGQGNHTNPKVMHTAIEE